MKFTKEEKRKYLREMGWRRTDRTTQGEHIEYWVDPKLNKYGFKSMVSLQTAFEKQKRREIESN